MIAPTTQGLERAIRGLVAAGSSLESRRVRPGQRGGPIPGDLFATVLLIHQDTEGLPVTPMSLSSDGLSLDAPTVATIRGRYSVQWFREGAHDAAKRFVTWVWSPTGLAHAHSAGLTVRRVSDVRQLDDVVSGAWEERAGVDIDIGYVQRINQTLGYLRSVPVEVGAGGRTESITIEV